MTIIDMDTLNPPRGRRFMAWAEAKWRAARDELWQRSAAKCDARRAAKLPKPVEWRPIVLKRGTACQVDEIRCSAARLFARKAETAGYQVRVTHARRIDPVKGSRQSYVVRWRYGDDHAGWCSWDGDSMGQAWSFDGAQVALITGERTVGLPHTLNATQAGDYVAARGVPAEIGRLLMERTLRAIEAKQKKQEKEMRINV